MSQGTQSLVEEQREYFRGRKQGLAIGGIAGVEQHRSCSIPRGLTDGEAII